MRTVRVQEYGLESACEKHARCESHPWIQQREHRGDVSRERVHTLAGGQDVVGAYVE